MSDDLDIEGLTPAQARSYVADFIATQKQTRDQLIAAEEDLSVWKKRVAMASDRGETDLAKDALSRAEEAHELILRLKRELGELDFKVLELKRRLGNLQSQPQMTVNADALLEQLESLVGTDHSTEEAVSDAEAEVALEALKKKMQSADPDGE